MAGNYPIEAVANSVLWGAEKRNVRLTPMKLQKLLYLCHGYYLAVTGQPLVDEDFEAWQYGPVSPSIYQEFKDCGSRSIDAGRRARNRGRAALGILDDISEIPDDDKQAARIVNFVLDTYGARTAIYLSDLTHKVGSPWEKVRQVDPPRRNAKITNDLIKLYFDQLVTT